MVFIRRTLIALFLVLLAPCLAPCEDPITPTVPTAESGVVLETPPVEPAAPEASLPDRFQAAWQDVVQLIAAKDAAALQDRLSELKRLRIEYDFRSLEDFSLQLLDAAKKHAADGHGSFAAFLTRKALELSPESAKVAIHSAPIADQTGVASIFLQVAHAVRLCFYDPGQIILIAKGVTYPLLWALTLAAYAGMLLTLCVNVRSIVGAATKFFPISVRGFMAPLAALFGVLLPVLFGPLWALAGWAVFVLVLFPKQRWLAFITGAVIAGWGAGIPLRETLSGWLDDDRVESLRRIVSGSYSRADEVKLRQLRDLRPTDGATHYAYGQLLRRLGEYDAAGQAFETAERLLGEQPYTKAQQGGMAYLRGDAAKAEEYFADAEKLGLNTAEFWFNYSKVKIELLDTETSQKFYEKARAADRDRTELLQDREVVLGESQIATLADIDLPLSLLWRSAVVPISGREVVFDSVAEGLMPGMNPKRMIFFGALIVLISLIPRREVLRRTVTYYNLYAPPRMLRGGLKLVPGGSWILVGRPAAAVILLSIVFFFAMPFYGWPLESAAILDAVPDLQRPYGFALFGLVVVCWCLSVLTANTEGVGEG